MLHELSLWIRSPNLFSPCWNQATVLQIRVFGVTDFNIICLSHYVKIFSVAQWEYPFELEMILFSSSFDLVIQAVFLDKACCLWNSLRHTIMLDKQNKSNQSILTHLQKSLQKWSFLVALGIVTKICSIFDVWGLWG